MKTAIIADDELLSCELLAHLLTTYNLPIEIVACASDGEEAVSLILELKPDIVFLDIEMPVYNGVQVMEIINGAHNYQTVFVVITAYNDFAYAQSALRLGAKDILLKPIEPKQFIDMIERVLNYKYTHNDMLNSVLEYLDKNVGECPGLTQCALKFHLSPNYLARLFKKYLGKSYVCYVNELKIKMAMRLLKETDLTIKEVSDTVGYNNLNYFYKNFNQLTGATPKMFRTNNK